MKRSYLIAMLLAILAVAWVASGQIGDAEQALEVRKPPARLETGERISDVRVRRQQAEVRMTRIMVRGRSEALRSVDVKAETHGRVVELGAEKGARVAAGDLLVRLEAKSRPARVKEAKALVRQRRIEFEAASTLSEKGFRAETQLAASQAALEAAEAALQQAEVELADLKITAPFDGILEERMVEIGDYVETGDPVAQVVDLDPILVVAAISERDVEHIAVGTLGTARLITGQLVEGVVRYVASRADPQTRTFRVELEAPNEGGAISDGVSAELSLPRDRELAHLVSPAILTLSDDGRIGVKTVDADNRVRFLPVRIVESAPDGVWLAGLPEAVTLITVGQEFVTEGQTVQPIDEATLGAVALPRPGRGATA